MDIGAETPEEIALSILTEIVQRMRANPEGVSLAPATQADDAESIDPICNMTVKVAASRYVSNYNGKRRPLLLSGVQGQVRAGTRTLPASGDQVDVWVSFAGAKTMARKSFWFCHSGRLYVAVSTFLVSFSATLHPQRIRSIQGERDGRAAWRT